MKKFLIAFAVVLVVVGLGVLAFYRAARRHFFVEFSKPKVAEAIKALDADDSNVAFRCSLAEGGLETAALDRPWVSQGEIDAARQQLEAAKAKLREKYTAKALAWKMGEGYTFAIVTYQFQKWEPGDRSEWYPRTAKLAMLLDVPLGLPESPTEVQESEPAKKQQYVREGLDAMAKAINDKQGADAEKLFRLSSATVLALMAAKKRDPFPERSAGYPDEIARLGKETGLPEKLWQPVVEALATKASADALGEKLVELENGATDFLEGKPSEATEKK